VLESRWNFVERNFVRIINQGSYGSGKTGKVREFEWSGKDRGKIFFGKVREKVKGEYRSF